MPCCFNATCLSMEGSRPQEYRGLTRQLTPTELWAMTAVAALTTLCNLLVLLASKYTTGGKSATLVFIRSLCVSDVLVGTYGLSKLGLFWVAADVHVNFFLPESLFVTALFAFVWSLLLLNVDCYWKLAKPLNYTQRLDKGNTITLLVVLWNLAFILGFLPQMGWHSPDMDYVCNFFAYYPWHYLLFVAVTLFAFIAANAALLIYLKRKTVQIRSGTSFLPATSSEFRRYNHLVVSVAVDLGLWLTCYLPFFVYLALFCHSCPLSDRPESDINLVYFIPVFMVKSLISGVVHAYRTAQIQAVVKRFSRKVSRMIPRKRQQGKQHQHHFHRNGVKTISLTTNSFEVSSASDAGAEGGGEDGEEGEGRERTSSIFHGSPLSTSVTTVDTTVTQVHEIDGVTIEITAL